MSDNKKKVSADEINRIAPLLSSFSSGRNLKLNTDISSIMKTLKTQESNKKRPKSGFVIQKPKKSTKKEPTVSPVIKKEVKSQAGPSKPRLEHRKSKTLVQEEGSLYGQGFKVEPSVARSSFSTRSSPCSTPVSRGSQKLIAKEQIHQKEEEEDFDWDDVLNKEYSDEDEEFLTQDQPIVLPHYKVGSESTLDGFPKLRKILDDKKLKEKMEDSKTQTDQEEPKPDVDLADIMKTENKKPFLITFPDHMPFAIPKDDKEDEEKTKGNIFEGLQTGRIGKVVVRKSGKVEWHVGDLKFKCSELGRMTRKRILVQSAKIDDENEKITQLAEIVDSMGIHVDTESLRPIKPQNPMINLCDQEES